MNEHYHFYYIKDHLGNVRETYKIPNAGTKECVQRMQYYPSGLPWEENMNSSEQPHKYNGKEFVEMHGLDEYDSEARWYYPAICRTTTMDPLAEKYYSTSPYAWCGNNPVRFVDPLGMSYNINSDGSVEQVNDSVDNQVVLNADNEREKVEITLEEGDIVGVEETDEVNILELENKKAAEELYNAMGIYMNTLEFNNVISEKDGVLHYYVGNSGAMHETKVGGYIFLTLYETINFMSHFHPQSPKASEKDKENAEKYYRNTQDYPHANPNAKFEIMYLGSDGELKTTKY